MLGNTLFPDAFHHGNILQLRLHGGGGRVQPFHDEHDGQRRPRRSFRQQERPLCPLTPGGEDFAARPWAIGALGQGASMFVWPIGPSSLRDSIGRVGDYFTDPATTHLQP